MCWSFYGLFAVCVTGAFLFTIRSALHEIQVVHVEDENSLDDTMEQAKESGRSQLKNCETIDSDNNSDAFESEDQNENREIEPLTPTPQKQNKLQDFNSPTSSLSSHLSDYFANQSIAPQDEEANRIVSKLNS